MKSKIKRIAQAQASTSTKSSTAEIRVVAPQEVGVFSSAISAGDHFTCGVTQGGEVYCWGQGTYGRLGQGDDDLSHTNIPRAVSLPEEMVSVSAGVFHACALSAQGNVYCWGYGRYAALGDGREDRHNRTTPYPINASLSGITNNFSSVSTGSYSTCGVHVNGSVYCWGSNFTAL